MTAVAKWGNSIEDRPEKIAARHHDRLAVVYVRQSSRTQVHRNQESTKIQYGLTGMAQQLGWARERILTIDDDLGISGASAEGRLGFQRLLSEVAFDHVGIILGVEMSRLARSNKDWHQLLELCARFGTLIADLDGLYDPSRYNDRLLLGLKGTMSEAELHILRQRLLQGKLQKARRGELGKPVPVGYLRRESGEVILDPDEEVRDVVRLIFETFDRVSSEFVCERARISGSSCGDDRTAKCSRTSCATRSTPGHTHTVVDAQILVVRFLDVRQPDERRCFHRRTGRCACRISCRRTSPGSSTCETKIV
jgi:DNA invertase Pin-like site-specific DNA recombinase